MTTLESGWEEPTTVRRELKWPAFLDLAVTHYAREAGVPPTVAISTLVEEGLELEAETLPANGNGSYDRNGPDVVRAMLWPIELEGRIEERAQRSHTDDGVLICRLVEARLVAHNADLRAAATRATEIFG